MAEWYKEKNMIFKLKDLIVNDDFKLWKAYQTEFPDAEQTAQYGVVLQFPVKEGQLPGTDGVSRDVQTQIKYLKKDEFEKCYPKLGKRTQYIRVIIVAGVEYNYGFSKTSNDKLNAMLAMSPGQLPDVDFKQTFDKNLPPASMYNVIVATADEVGKQVAPQPTATAALSHNPTQPVTPPAIPSSGGNQAVSPPQVQPVQTKSSGNVIASSVGLSDGEKTILASVKGLPNKLTQEQFIKVFTKNLGKVEFGKIPVNKASQRALEIFDAQYK